MRESFLAYFSRPLELQSSGSLGEQFGARLRLCGQTPSLSRSVPAPLPPSYHWSAPDCPNPAVLPACADSEYKHFIFCPSFTLPAHFLHFKFDLLARPLQKDHVRLTLPRPFCCWQ